MTVTRHLLTVWNPSYAADAMEQHLALLLHHAARVDQGHRNPDSLYVWWGKVRSPNRQGPQANLDEIRDIARELDAEARDEVQLYLTDYHSLYVGDVDRICVGDLPAAEEPHVPAYYRTERLTCDCWFQLRDIRRLVAADLAQVVAELKKLRNVRYHDRPVSLYGGMVDLPLIVRRDDGARFFDEADRESRIGDRLWAEFDQEVGSGVAAMERELRLDLFGERAWDALEPDVRTAIASAEKTFRERRDDPGFDFAPVVVGLAKAMEVQVNAVLRRVLPALPQPARLAKIGDHTRDLADFRQLSLGELARALGGERLLVQELSRRLQNGAWLTTNLPPVLEDLAGVRNPAAHTSRIDRGVAQRIRERLLGVGCSGEFVELWKVRPVGTRASCFTHPDPSTWPSPPIGNKLRWVSFQSRTLIDRMARPPAHPDIHHHLARLIASGRQGVAAMAASELGISRQAVNKHLREMVDAGLITAKGSTRSRSYALVTETTTTSRSIQGLQEDVLWRELVADRLTSVPDSVRSICQYGFTEMVNNAIDHSGGMTVHASLGVNAAEIAIAVWDDGVGIFRKIKEAFGLENERHAILELSKGKLTTDPSRHTGEGIFFTSRVFDFFAIVSGSFIYQHSGIAQEGDWLYESEPPPAVPPFGTQVLLRIDAASTRTLARVFDQFAANEGDYRFDVTYVAVRLARMGEENLVSRSQARRLLARVDRFARAILDFQGVTMIGQAFADEIFRVYRSEHPRIDIQWVNAAPDVERMIRRAISASRDAAT